MLAFLSAPITSVDATLAALAGGLIIGSELRGVVARLPSWPMVGRLSSASSSARSFDRVSSADRENGAGHVEKIRKVVGGIRNVER